MSEKNIKLVIAEKPSVAQSIAKVIGADKREDGYLEGKLQIFWEYMTVTCTIFGKMKSMNTLQWIL